MARVPSKGRKNAAVLRARALRREMSLPEGLLWQVLRTRPGDLKFRHQHPFDRSTADFYCAAARLVIEVDGDSHSMGRRPEDDRRRDAWLRSLGIKVLRFDAADVFRDVNVAVAAIMLEARRRLPLHHASHGSPPHADGMGRNCSSPSPDGEGNHPEGGGGVSA
jgi:very-short-patch-repair endonuclease